MAEGSWLGSRCLIDKPDQLTDRAQPSGWQRLIARQSPRQRLALIRPRHEKAVCRLLSSAG